MARRRAVVGICCTLSVLAAGCDGEAAAPEAAEIRAGIGSIGSLDPLVTSSTEHGRSQTLIVRHVVEGLVRYDPDTLEPEPAVASSWRVADDARTFTFTVRDGAVFHSGRQVTAVDALLWPVFQSDARANHMGYSSPEVDRLLRVARGTVDARERHRLLGEAERHILRDLPVLPLLWHRSSVAFADGVATRGERLVDGLGLTDFSRVGLEG